MNDTLHSQQSLQIYLLLLCWGVDPYNESPVYDTT